MLHLLGVDRAHSTIRGLQQGQPPTAGCIARGPFGKDSATGRRSELAASGAGLDEGEGGWYCHFRNWAPLRVPTNEGLWWLWLVPTGDDFGL